MSKILKRFLLIVPMVACLCALSTTAQQANIKSVVSSGSATQISGKGNPSGETKAFTGGFVEDYCDQSEVIDIPPIFGFPGITIAFGTGCGENSDQNCVSAASYSGGKFSFHVQCEEVEDEEDAN